MIKHISDADLSRLEQMLVEAEKSGGFSTRIDIIDQHGYDTKAAYHVVRLLGEIEQLLVEHDLDLERNREQLKSIRRGEWTLEQIESHFTDKERALEAVYASSTLPHSPDEAVIKNILLQALEMHYGDISTAVARNPSMDAMLNDFKAVIARYEGR